MIGIAQSPSVIRKDKIDQYNWKDNLSVQQLFDVIVAILAEEYIQVAKANGEAFLDPGYSASRNSGMTHGGEDDKGGFPSPVPSPQRGEGGSLEDRR